MKTYCAKLELSAKDWELLDAAVPIDTGQEMTAEEFIAADMSARLCSHFCKWLDDELLKR